MLCLTDLSLWQSVDVDGLLVTLRLRPEGDLGEWLVKHGHASFASFSSISPPPPLVDRSSPATDRSSPSIYHTAPLVNHTSSSVDHTLAMIDHSSQPGNDSSLQFHSPLVLDEREASQSIDDGPACESGEEEI